MGTITQLKDLLGRLEKAEGPDREIDALIDCVVLDEGWIMHDKLPVGYTMKSTGNANKDRQLAKAPYITSKRGPSKYYTASLDTTIALVEKVLPEWWIQLDGPSPETQVYTCDMYHPESNPYLRCISAESKTWPLAVLTAMTKALIAEGETG